MPTSSILQASLAYILRNEGGFVNKKNDRGGPTNFGITIKTLSKWRNRTATIEDVKNMTADEAELIYWTWYLKPLCCDQLKSQSIALCLADTCVLYSVETAIHYAQTVCNGYGYKLDVDGIVGPATLTALNSVNPSLFIKDFHDILLIRIGSIITDDPTQQEFRNGWVARADRLLKLIG